MENYLNLMRGGQFQEFLCEREQVSQVTTSYNTNNSRHGIDDSHDVVSDIISRFGFVPFRFFASTGSCDKKMSFFECQR